MYTIYIGNEILHNPMFELEGRIVIDPVLTETLNAHGSLKFSVAPTNPCYDSIEIRKTKIRVVNDSGTSKQWFGRVMEIGRGWNNTKSVYCEGELGLLCDAIYQPFGFSGSPRQLLENLVSAYNSSGVPSDGYRFYVGNVTVTDPNDTIVRSSNRPMSVWDAIKSKLFGSSLGGYIFARYDSESNRHYIDYLTLDENDAYTHISSQTIEFGKNLILFSECVDASNVVTCLLPYGATQSEGDPEYTPEAPENGSWNGNRLTIKAVNDGVEYIKSDAGRAIWGDVWGTKTWDDVTIASNLLRKSRAWLENQIQQNISLEINAVDLSNLDADIEQINVGDTVRTISEPHNLNTLLMCTKKTTPLTRLEDAVIELGGSPMAISDMQGSSAYSDGDSYQSDNGYGYLDISRIRLSVDNGSNAVWGSSGYGAQSAFVTPNGKIFILNSHNDSGGTNGTYSVLVNSNGTWTRTKNKVDIGINTGHANSTNYANGYAYVSFWNNADAAPNQTTIRVFSVDEDNETMTYVKDLTVPVAYGRTDFYVMPGESEIYSLSWSARSSANSAYMILGQWKLDTSGVYQLSWEKVVNNVDVCQAMCVHNGRMYIVSDHYDSTDGYSHDGIVIVDLASGEQTKTTQTGNISTLETEAIIPVSARRFYIVANRGQVFNATETIV